MLRALSISQKISIRLIIKLKKLILHTEYSEDIIKSSIKHIKGKFLSKFYTRNCPLEEISASGKLARSQKTDSPGKPTQ
jgi:hypothetical protein